MPYKKYENNKKTVTNTTYTPMSFSNSESKISPSKLSISYFNQVMKVSIAMKMANSSTNQSYATYDNDNAATVYLSWSQAKILYDLIQDLKSNQAVHNVCVQLKNGMLMVSDGSDYGSSNPCISISTADENGNVTTTIYECKSNFYFGAVNYSEGDYVSKFFDDLELTAFETTMIEYFKASTYAVAASVMEASMYKRQSMYDLTKSIADKVGVVSPNSGKSGSFTNQSMINKPKQQDVPKEYSTTTFDEIAGY